MFLLRISWCLAAPCDGWAWCSVRVRDTANWKIGSICGASWCLWNQFKYKSSSGFEDFAKHHYTNLRCHGRKKMLMGPGAPYRSSWFASLWSSSGQVDDHAMCKECSSPRQCRLTSLTGKKPLQDPKKRIQIDFSRNIQDMFCFCFGIFKPARRNQSNLFKCFWFLWLLYTFFILLPFKVSGSNERGQQTKNSSVSAEILGEQEYTHQTHDKFAWGRAVIAFSENLADKKISSLKSSVYVGVGMCDMILPQVWLYCGASNLSLPLHPPLHPVFAWVCFTLGRDGTLQ